MHSIPISHLTHRPTTHLRDVIRHLAAKLAPAGVSWPAALRAALKAERGASIVPLEALRQAVVQFGTDGAEAIYEDAAAELQPQPVEVDLQPMLELGDDLPTFVGQIPTVLTLDEALVWLARVRHNNPSAGPKPILAGPLFSTVEKIAVTDTAVVIA